MDGPVGVVRSAEKGKKIRNEKHRQALEVWRRLCPKSRDLIVRSHLIR